MSSSKRTQAVQLAGQRLGAWSLDPFQHLQKPQMASWSKKAFRRSALYESFQAGISPS